MGSVIATLTDLFEERLDRQRNRPFLEGVMAACALVATTDGEVSFAEHVRVDQILQTLDQLRIFDPHEGVELFRGYAEGIIDNPQEGHEKALEAVAGICGDPENGALMLRICLARRTVRLVSPTRSRSSRFARASASSRSIADFISICRQTSS